MTRLPMHPVDAAWLHMDGRANAAIVTVLLTARRRFDADAVRDQFERRFASLPAFRRRVADATTWAGVPEWIEDEGVDIAQHVHHRALPAGATARDLRALVEDLASAPLPAGLPPWQVHVVDGPGAGGAVVLRYHHCLGDGAAMMMVARQVFDGEGAREPLPPGRRAEPPAPPSLVEAAGQLAATSVESAAALVRDLLRSADPAGPLKGALATRQRLAWSRPIPLVEVRHAAHAQGAHLNDLVVAAVAGALRAYLREGGAPGTEERLRAMMPVNLRGAGAGGDGSGNEFGLVLVDLPVEVADAAGRLEAAKTRMTALKASAEAGAMHGLFEVFGRGPKALQQVAQFIFGRKASLVLSNVAGPARPLRLAGRAIDRMVFWVPHPGDELGLGISVLSYRGGLSFGVLGDAHRIPEPERIVAGIEAEMDVLCRLARRGRPAPRHGP
ncbi:MAG TPA: wax ester/triacylglycerol synthase family O-acyltransferase, partial [Burkholderiaceae bacterium]